MSTTVQFPHVYKWRRTQLWLEYYYFLSNTTGSSTSKMLITFLFYRQISSSLYSVVHCLSLRWFRVSYLHRSPARESRMSLCVQAAANCATITGNSSPEVMMIMDFAANDFGWAALLASSAESAAIFINKKRWREGYINIYICLFLYWLDQIWTTYWAWWVKKWWSPRMFWDGDDKQL